MTKKIISFLTLALILVVFAVSAFAETAPLVTVGSVIGETGATVEIPVVLSGNTGFSNLGIEIGYDETALVLKEVTVNSDTGATFTKAQEYTVNPYNMSWDSASNTAFNGTLVTLTFEIITDTNGDYAVTVDYYKGRNGNYVDGNNVNYDENFNALNLGYVNGTVTVTGNDEPIVKGPSISVGKASGKTGATVEVPVILEENTGFSNLGIEIGYDNTALTLTGVVANASTGATFTPAQNYLINPYNMSWDSPNNITFNGTLVTLTFKIIASKDGTYPITVDYYKGRNGNYVDGSNVNYDENFASIGLKYANGSVLVQKEEKNSISVNSNLNVTLSGEVNVGSVYAALYRGGKVNKVKIYPASENIDITFDSMKSGDIVKVMWWKENLKPMCEEQTVLIQ